MSSSIPNMKKISTTTIALIASLVIAGGTSVFAQEEQKISRLDRQELRELRELGDRDAFKQRLRELGIERKDKPPLTKDQKRQGNLPLQSENDRSQKITELKDTESFKEIGINKNRKSMNKRVNATDSLTEDEKEALEEARDIARAGNKEAAKEILRGIFEDNRNNKSRGWGIKGFFNRFF